VGQLCERRGKAAPGAGPADRDARRVDGGQPREPRQRRVAIVQRRRVRVFGRQPIVDGRHGDSEFTREPTTERVVLGGVPDHVSAAVDPQQPRSGAVGIRRAVQVYADTRRQGQHLDVGGRTAQQNLRRHADQRQRQRMNIARGAKRALRASSG
jgi:hypothetical protein